MLNDALLSSKPHLHTHCINVIIYVFILFEYAHAIYYCKFSGRLNAKRVGRNKSLTFILLKLL